MKISPRWIITAICLSSPLYAEEAAAPLAVSPATNTGAEYYAPQAQTELNSFLADEFNAPNVVPVPKLNPVFIPPPPPPPPESTVQSGQPLEDMDWLNCGMPMMALEAKKASSTPDIAR